MITEFIKSNYESALNSQLEIKQDLMMIQSIETNTLNSQLVKNWMRGYGLFQGITREVEGKVAEIFMEFSQFRKEKIDIGTEFRSLHEALLKAQTRKWLSASSKLLWCMYPKQIVIYDSFVERAITVLQCIDESLAKFPRIKTAPSVNDEKYLDYYLNYEKLVKTIQTENQDVLNEQKRKYESTYEYDLRIIDKILWMMGNANSKFWLKGIECK